MKNHSKTNKETREQRFIVAKSNILASTKARYYLPIKAQRLILTLISKIHPDDQEFQRYSFEIPDLYKLLNLQNQNKTVRRDTLKKALNYLQRNLVEIVLRDAGGGEILMSPAWIESPIFDWSKGLISLRVSETLKPYLLNLQRGNRTQYLLEMTKKFRSDYSLRFFEFCRNYEPRDNYHDEIRGGFYVNIITFDLKELRRALGIPASRYPKPKDFKRRILDAAQREVNEKTSARFEIEIIRDHLDMRRVKAVKMLIFGEKVPENENPAPSPASPPSLPEIEPRDQRLWRRMLVLGISRPLAAVAFGSKYGREKILDAVEAIEEYQQNHKIKYPNSIFNRALLDEWLSKRAQRRNAGLAEEIKKQNRIEADKQLEKKQEERKKSEETQAENYHCEQMFAYEKRLDEYKSEFKQVTDKTAYIVSLYEKFDDLPDDEKQIVTARIERLISHGADFDAICEVAARAILGYFWFAGK